MGPNWVASWVLVWPQHLANEASFEASSLEEASLEEGPFVGRSSLGRISMRPFRGGPVKGNISRVSIPHIRDRAGKGGMVELRKNIKQETADTLSRQTFRCREPVWSCIRTEAIGFKFQPSFDALRGADPHTQTRNGRHSNQPPTRQLRTKLMPN